MHNVDVTWSIVETFVSIKNQIINTFVHISFNLAIKKQRRRISFATKNVYIENRNIYTYWSNEQRILLPKCEIGVKSVIC